MTETVTAVLVFNSLTLVVLGTLAWICGFQLQVAAFDVVGNALQSTCNLTCVLYIWQVVGLYAAQGFYRINVRNLAVGVVLNILCVGLFHVVLVVFGAPLTHAVRETLTLAALLSTLTYTPCALVLGLNSNNWTRLFLVKSDSSPPSSPSPESPLERNLWVSTVAEPGDLERAVRWCSLGGVVGVWLGGVPIPLDWDRPWQVWPISCVLGALIGYACGLICSVIEILGRNLERKIKDV